ncbi:MAG: STAS domain-containing protein [Gammaproteobacteria bacterium]
MSPLEDSIFVREREVDGVIVLSVVRELKGAGEATLKQRIDHLVSKGYKRILIDLNGLPHIDSTDLGRLIRCHLSVRQAGGRVRICNISEQVWALLKLTRLDTVLDLFPTEQEALASMHASPSLPPVPPV